MLGHSRAVIESEYHASQCRQADYTGVITPAESVRLYSATDPAGSLYASIAYGIRAPQDEIKENQMIRAIVGRSSFLSIGMIFALFTTLSACSIGLGTEAYPPVGTAVPAVEDAYPEPVEVAPEKPQVEEEAGLGGMRLLVGTDAEYPPFESVENGEIVGFDPALMDMLCQLADCEAEFVATAWDGIFAALGAGEFDAVMSAITILPERETDSGGTFTDPYFSVGQVVLVRADEAGIFGVEDLAGAVVGVQTGTTGDTAATDDAGVLDENIQRFDSNALAVQALLNKDVDAVVCDNPTAENYVSANTDQLMVVGEAFTIERYGILVSNERPEVLAALNDAIARLNDQGMIDTLKDEWMDDAGTE